ncbi:hypothetical protein UUU_38260 [Klebsiella pneumoniae subsp. pneumoniae DSM 30104 = JCM 1662 = NBRC 14940]|nr:hypothetical protein UUU_38260 [Klebsiella pneumoniae subsp. pneumoniae DSM 30104 = JCM 1662 = NBRC 14940]
MVNSAPASPCRLTAAQAALLAPKAIVTATIFAAIDFIIKFLQIKKSPIWAFGHN